MASLVRSRLQHQPDRAQGEQLSKGRVMSWKSRPRFRVRVVYPLFVLGGFMLGLGVAFGVIPDDPAVGRAAGTGTVGLLALIIAQQTAKEEDKPTSAE